MYLIDTMVLSEQSKDQSVPAVEAWLKSSKLEDMFVSVVSLGEIERGIYKLEKREGRPAHRYRRWLDFVLGAYAGRILPVTVEIARRWGPLSYDHKHTNPDLLIAATALEHDLTIVTRNVRDFEPTGVKLLNPYEA